jgi:hypothetical protein
MIKKIRTMKIKLNNNFYLEIEEYAEDRWRIIKNRYEQKDLEKYKDKKFSPKAIYTKNGNLVCYAEEINEFLELLGAFVSNQLNSQKVYGFSYTNGGGFYGQIVKRKDTVCLSLKVDKKENHILEKYDCRVIIANAKYALTKCTLQEFI